MISFDNTEVAFSAKDDKALNRAYWLFKMVGNNKLVKFGKSMTNLALKLHLPIKPAVKATIFKQFCGGEDIQECRKATAELAKFNIGTILDYSVEGKTSEEDFDATRDEIIATIEEGNAREEIPFAVFKITGIARFGILEKANGGVDQLNEADQKAYDEMVERVDAICKRAYETGTPVFIDAEESWIQDTIDRVADDMMAKYNKEKAIVYNTIQMYRWDRLDFFKASHKKAEEGNYFLGVKLVRGAYMEKERARAEKLGEKSPIQVDKASSDQDYDKALRFALENISRISICAGTHNENSSLLLTELLKEFNVDKGDKRVYFAQLLGMSDHISYNLSAEGYNVAKYVPYGPVKEVLPYLIRRAEENTSVKGQTGRELGLILKEKARRKGQ